MTYIRICQPQDLTERNRLLQECLRPEPLPFPIATEYPLVLSPEEMEFSYGIFQEDKICSHANLWPRRVLNLTGEEVFKVGLVGNVATHSAWRGHGLMRSLLTAIEEEATRQELDALILWSDLESFYHKLGFKSVGKEYRFGFLAGDFTKSMATRTIRSIKGKDLSAEMLKYLMELRPKIPLTLERSAEEFQRLLNIPWLELYLSTSDSAIDGYAMVGKGYDMLGIVHEWAAKDCRGLLDILAQICRSKQLEQITLLAPRDIPSSWIQELKKRSALIEEYPMALMRPLNDRVANNLDKLFIWGLDSI